MSLAPDTRLGPYTIVTTLGVGGMGEVYRARDVRLGREVAVKVLSTSVATDAERLRRFEQEARAASALNHPAILTIHDFGQHDGVPYVVSELLEGQTLRERIGGAGLPLRKALEYAVQLARGLAAAHDKGIVHRDLKPENVFVTSDGRVKILDFGLAKLTPGAALHPAGLESPTIDTEPGVILGTVGYMSPEQVRGLPTDHRADIFSFGVILYEMVTGARAFARESSVETLNAILKEEPPDLAATNSSLQEGVRRIISHCLEKDPADRFQSLRDVAFYLESFSDPSVSLRLPAPVEAHRRSKARYVGAAIAAASLVAIAYFLGVWQRSAPASPTPVSVARLTDFDGLEETPAVSPDGKSVAFTAYAGDKRQVWIKLVAGGAALQITRDDADHQMPRWAPDGATLMYYTPPKEGDAQGTLWEVATLGGSSRRIANSIGGADISHDGKRIAYFRFEKDQIELVVASRSGAEPRAIARLPLGTYYLSPRWSPDDRMVAYQAGYVFTHDVYAVDAAGGQPRRVTNEGRLLSGFCWTRDGSGLVFSTARGSSLLYLPTFNLWSVGVNGERLRQITFGEVSYVDPDLDPGGLLVAGRVTKSLDLWKFPVDGEPVDNLRRATRITRQTSRVQTPSVGATDREIVYLSDSGGHANLWIVDTGTGVSRQLTYEQNPEIGLGVPVWSPDGRYIAFYSTREGLGGNWIINPDGGNLRQLFRAGGWATWSSDGRWLYYNENVQNTAALGEMKKIRPEGGEAVPVRNDKGNRPAISPDGSTLYFVIERPAVSGGSDYEVRVAKPESGPSQVIATIPARRIPLWQLVHPVISPDGKWLALPLTDGPVTNLWLLPTAGGPLRQVTDFGQRPTYIARRVSWSTDGKAIFAAFGEGNADIVLIRGAGPAAGQRP
jgi:Tol biopolymer transport system component